MKAYLIICLTILFSSRIHAQDKTMPSKIFGEDRTVLVHTPKGNGRFPVLYLLDGASNFDMMVSITEYLSSEGFCPAMMVVGIIHPDRTKDLVPAAGNLFMSYLGKELMPYIDSAYPTTTYRTLVGHSLGGLTVINTLLHQPNLFNAYVSLEGALWWDDQRTVKEASRILPGANYKGKTLFLAMANRMEKGIDTFLVQKDTSGNTDLIRSNLTLVKDIMRNQQNALRFQHKYYQEDNHSSVRLIGEYDALRFLFDFYKLNIYNSQYENPAFKLDSLLVSHYKKVSAYMGYLVLPNESQVNSLGYRMLSMKQYDKAETMFQMNIANYPQNANGYDSMGDLFLAKENKVKAIEYFRKTLSIQNIPETKEKLDKLLGK
ncbi:MAG: alpha/beta hydrolase-fold protein [Bacteroidota bacterium]